MSAVHISVTYSDGDAIHVAAVGKASYPDCLDQLRATAVAAVRDTIAATRFVDE